MKIKKKKLENIITQSIEKAIRGVEVKKREDDIYLNMGDYDKSISEKFKKLLLSMVNHSEDSLNINISESTINISCDIDSFKRVKNDSNNLKPSKVQNENDYLEVSIRKGKGFFINRGYNKKSSYKDDNIYDELLPEVRKILKTKNSNNFDDIYSGIMVDSGIIRDVNLDDLLQTKKE